MWTGRTPVRCRQRVHVHTMDIGKIDIEELKVLAPRLAATQAIVLRLEGQVRLANLNPAHVTTWIKAGVLVPPPLAWFRSEAWLVPVNHYVSNARLYAAAFGGDEEYGSLVAAAGFSPAEARAWSVGERPSVQRLREMIALRKFVVPEMDESTPPPPAPRLRKPVDHQPSGGDAWAEGMRR